MEKKWSVSPVDAEERSRLAEGLRCSPLVAGLLLRRGITSAEEGARFLKPRLQDLHDPFLLPDMDRAAARIESAVRAREPIAVCGDYDVDGLSATALLVEFFKLLDYPVRTHIPHRIEEGYGLGRGAVERLAADGARLIVTVDNGSSAVEEIALAVELGIDVVVVDHHQPSAVAPPAYAMVNPWAPGSTYPFPHLAGVGVTFKLVWALSQRFSRSRKVSPEFRDFMMEALSLAALGTISDVVPLFGENRVLAKHGLAALQSSKRPGLKRLVAGALRSDEGRLTAEHVAFRIGPAINAAGRLGDAEAALRLLITSSPEEADQLALVLDRQNRERRRIEGEIHAAARSRIAAEMDLRRERAIVLADQGWHPGVIGIVAARIVEEFCRPTLLIALDAERGRGSARSIAGVHICDALRECSSHLLAYGGHAHAAGVEVESASVEALRQALNGAIRVAPEDMVPVVEIEAEVGLLELSHHLLGELTSLEPFGQGNRAPLFASLDLEVAGTPRAMGEGGEHLSFFVKKVVEGRGGCAAMRAVIFGKRGAQPSPLKQGQRVDLVFRPTVNRWGGAESIELEVKDLRSSGRPEQKARPASRNRQKLSG